MQVSCVACWDAIALSGQQYGGRSLVSIVFLFHSNLSRDVSMSSYPWSGGQPLQGLPRLLG